MSQADVILETLEQVGDLCPDPGPLVYARLFELHPEFEGLFVMDGGGEVRGTMLETSLTCLMGLAEDDDTQALQLAANRAHHEGYGVGADKFDAMFTAIRDVCRDLLGAAWTSAHGEAWKTLLDKAAHTN